MTIYNYVNNIKKSKMTDEIFLARFPIIKWRIFLTQKILKPCSRIRLRITDQMQEPATKTWLLATCGDVCWYGTVRVCTWDVCWYCTSMYRYLRCMLVLLRWVCLGGCGWSGSQAFKQSTSQLLAEAVLWIRVRIGSVFRSLMDPYSEYESGSTHVNSG